LEVEQWRADTNGVYGLPVDMDAAGEGASNLFSQHMFATGAWDYTALDLPYRHEQLSELESQRCAAIAVSQCFSKVPTTAEGLAVTFNVQDSSAHRITTLRLTRETVCKILTGAITMWNDPAIVAANPAFASLNRPMRLVARSDLSDLNLMVSAFCIAVAPDVWSAYVAAEKNSVDAQTDSPEFLAGKPTAQWPTGGWLTQVVSDDGVASYIANPGSGDDAIGFVTASSASVRAQPVARIENAAGNFVAPNATNVTAGIGKVAATDASPFTPDLTNADPAAYQPDEIAWVVAATHGLAPAKGVTLATYLCFAVTTGQSRAAPLRDAPISPQVRDLAFAAIQRIPGAPDPRQCAAQPPLGSCVIKSMANRHYVSADLGQQGALQGVLRARATSVGRWERFECDVVATNRWTILSDANHRYVSSLLGTSGQLANALRADATAAGSTTANYSFVPVPGCGCFAIRGPNGRYVSAELANPVGTYALLRARSSTIGPWEKFTLTQP
jgi:ABC-type phosphate transport system substrate-binding protein